MPGCHAAVSGVADDSASQARNRTARAVERTIPFQLACQAITTCWCATAGYDPADTETPLIRTFHPYRLRTG